MSKVGLILSGCGVKDGSEIHEAVLTHLALDGAGAETVWAAPSIDQADVVDHLSGTTARGERRNVLVESARIARGNVRDLRTIEARELGAAIFVGGFGAAKNLCSFAREGAECSVNPEVGRLIRELHAARKPQGFVCIAPVVAARVLGSAGVRPTLTIGTDPEVATAIQAMGATHCNCDVRDVVVDRDHRIVTTPAYMLAGRISEVAEGVQKLVKAVLDLA